MAVRSTTLLVVATLVMATAGPGATQTAAQTPDTERWRFSLTPYFWAAGIDGKVATLPGAPTAEVDASFTDIIEQTNGAVMLAAVARRGRFGVLADLTYLDLSDDSGTPGPLFDEVEFESQTLFATIAGFYQVLETERLNLQAVAGTRLWYVDTELHLRGELAANQTFSEDKVWADPIVGVRWQGHLGRKFYLEGAADVGGFGVASDITWELLGTLAYRFNDGITMRAGYRHLKVDYEDDGFVWDVELSGPIVGVTIQF